MALAYSKGKRPEYAEFARGGPSFATRSRFMKVPDTFRTSIQKQDYEKKGKGGEQSELSGETKSLKPVVPRT